MVVPTLNSSTKETGKSLESKVNLAYKASSWPIRPCLGVGQEKLIIDIRNQ